VKIVAAHPGPSFSVSDVHNGWVEAFRLLGHQVSEYNLDERLMFYDSALIELPDGTHKKMVSWEVAFQLATNGLYSTLFKLEPDILFFTSAFYYPPEMVKFIHDKGIKVVVLHTESPYEDLRQMEVAVNVDLNLINDPINLDRFREVNPVTYYMPQSYRPGFHCPGPVDSNLAADLAFVATGFPSRIKFLEAMDLDGLDVLLAGNWKWLDEDSHLHKFVAHNEYECLDNEQTVSVYRSAKMGMNLYRKEFERDLSGKGWAMGPREIEMAACGLFFLREPRGEGDEVLSMLPKIYSPEDASEKLHWYLERENQRVSIAARARSAIAEWTFQNRAIELMKLLEKIGVTNG